MLYPAIEALIADDVQPYKVYSPAGRGQATGDPIPRAIDHSHFRDEDIDKLWTKTQDILNLNVDDCLA